MLRPLARLAAVVVAPLIFAACGGGRCRGPGDYITVPQSRAADVARVTGTGPACDDTSITCSAGTPVVAGDGEDAVRAAPCTSYTVRAHAEGLCQVTFEFASGATPVTIDMTFRAVGRTLGPESCGGGLYAEESASTRVVPELSDGGTE